MAVRDGRPQVGIVMGSDSDWETMEAAAERLKHLEIDYEVQVMSAHRSPKLVRRYAEGARRRGLAVLIAGAGGAAHLAGVVAAHTTLPVIGVPVAAGGLGGLDALLATVQMPPGVPVATVAIGRGGAHRGGAGRVPDRDGLRPGRRRPLRRRGGPSGRRARAGGGEADPRPGARPRHGGDGRGRDPARRAPARGALLAGRADARAARARRPAGPAHRGQRHDRRARARAPARGGAGGHAGRAGDGAEREPARRGAAAAARRGARLLRRARRRLPGRRPAARGRVHRGGDRGRAPASPAPGPRVRGRAARGPRGGLMAVVRPLAGLRYDPAHAGEVGQLLAPPYDVITAAEQAELYARSPYNVIRLILPREAERGAAAAQTLRDWIAAGILAPDPEPALYLYTQQFSLPDGSTRRRDGLLCRLRLEDFSSGVVRPHERTLPGPKADRLALLRATGANLSAIFGLYARPGEPVRELLAGAELGAPLVDVSGWHQLWRVTDAAAIARVEAALADQTIIIADGHHRYETALAYRDEQPGNEAATYILAYLANMEEEGVVILPTHRLVRAPLGPDVAAVEAGRAAVAFLLNPPSMAQVREVCLAGEVMPEKSTYFYPKLATGLVFSLVGPPWV